MKSMEKINKLEREYDDLSSTPDHFLSEKEIDRMIFLKSRLMEEGRLELEEDRSVELLNLDEDV